MAELAVGLTRSVVEGALTKAQSAIEEEGKLRKSAQRDLVFITGEFQMMQSFLAVANEERIGNLVVMTWVRQIRELAFDVEDCIEFVVHLDKKSGVWRRLLRSCTPPCFTKAELPLDEAVDEIEQLKARVADVSMRNARYNLISDTGSKPVAQQQPTPSGAAGATVIHLLLEERDAAKRQQQGDLTQFITQKDDNLQVTSVWGTAGNLGTTSLIRKAYSDQEICTTFTSRAWVKLTQPFSPYEFIKCLMAQFYEETCKVKGHAVGVHVLQKMKNNDDRELFEEFEQKVTKNRYLVVLEDLSNMVQWDAVRTFLPDMKNGSWIIVSTQQSEIAMLCVGIPTQVLELKQFSAEHSVYAFFKEGSRSVREKTEVTDRVVSSRSCEISTSDLLPPIEAAGGSLPSSSSSSYPNEEIIITTSTMKSARKWIEENPLIGRDAELSELRNYVALTGFNSNHVCVSVWGIAGVGKSQLVRRLYYDRMIHGHQFDQYSWVHVSRRPFNIRDFSRDLLLGFQSESPEDKETAHLHMMGSKNPVHECRDLLKRKRCLVVIDDLQTKEEWDLIRENLVSPSNSVIIVVTTEASIATHCADKQELVFNVKGLQANEATDLFNNKLHRKKNQTSVEQGHKDIIEELIPKCGGLPKVIVAVAGLLATKKVNQMDAVRAINEMFIHQLETSPEFNSLRDFFDWMHAYFRTCPYYLKPCIFYMSIFPQDHSIRRRRLVRRWIAEGYSRDGEDQSAEHKGEEYLTKLLDLSIIQQPPLGTPASADAREVFCQVNGFIREYIVSRRMEENLVFELGENSTLTTQRTGRHLTIREGWDRDKIVFGSIDFSRLRSLTVFGEWKSFLISEDMKLLRVLDLEDATCVTDDDVEQVVKLLRRLKFLSLRNCGNIRHLPHSLGDLRQLQSLDVRHTSIATLPASVTKLQRLQYIRAGNAEDQSMLCPSVSCPLFMTCRRRNLFGVQVPRGIGKLTAMHTLGVINIGASGGKAILKELKELTQLRKLGVSGINKKNCNRFFTAISGHAYLESLLVQLDKSNEKCLDGISLHLKGIRSLKLRGPLDVLPNGMDQLCKLRKIDLEMGVLKSSDIELLGKLPELSILLLKVKKVEGDKLHFYVTVNGAEDYSYQNVSVLKITCSSTVHITFGGLALKNLELLDTHICTKSTMEYDQEKHKKLKQVFRTDLQ